MTSGLKEEFNAYIDIELVANSGVGKCLNMDPSCAARFRKISSAISKMPYDQRHCIRNLW